MILFDIVPNSINLFIKNNLMKIKSTFVKIKLKAFPFFTYFTFFDFIDGLYWKEHRRRVSKPV